MRHARNGLLAIALFILGLGFTNEEQRVYPLGHVA